MSELIVGVAYFNDVQNVKDGGGWYSLKGAPSRRFNGFPDLSSSYFWVTNIGLIDFRDLGLSRSAHLRHSCFFRTSLAAIAADCGFRQDSDVPLIVEALSGIASRAISLAKMSMPGIVLKDSLGDSIYDFLGIDDVSNDSAALYQPAFQAAFQENSLVAGNPWLQGAETSRLAMNKVDFAEEVLGYPFPMGAWRDEQTDMSINDFINLSTPALASVSVDLRTADHPELLAFGSQQSCTAVMREWITQPEAAMLLSAGAKIKFGHILRGSSINDSMSLPSLLTDNDLIRASYSGGLIADCFLSALTCKKFIKRGVKNARATRYFFPSRAIYLRSIDRMISYGLAKRLTDLNYIVSNYGMGSVSIRVTEDIYAQAIVDAADIGFSIVSSKFKEGD